MISRYLMRVKACDFIEHIKPCLEKFPDYLSVEKEQIAQKLDAMSKSCTPMRLNMARKEMVEQLLPKLKQYQVCLRAALKAIDSPTNEEQALLKSLKGAMKDYRDISKTMDEGKLICAMYAPTDEFAASVFAKFKSFYAEVKEKNNARIDEKKRIKNIPSVNKFRKEIVNLLLRCYHFAEAFRMRDPENEEYNEFTNLLNEIGKHLKAHLPRKTKKKRNETDTPQPTESLDETEAEFEKIVIEELDG